MQKGTRDEAMLNSEEIKPVAIQSNLSITDTLGTNCFACNIEVFLFDR